MASSACFTPGKPVLAGEQQVLRMIKEIGTVKNVPAFMLAAFLFTWGKYHVSG